jgi:probable HAF family extracellular repeat protein
MRDIGTLGGPDTAMEALNARGQIAGSAYTSTTIDPITNAPITHPFLYSDGRMRDLGTLGGTSAVFGGLNDLGQVVGQSNLAGDDRPPHPFLWDGAHLRDLGTLGGALGSASFIDNAGRIVGFASLADEATTHAFLFKRGTMTDLSGPGGPPCTGANAVNAAEQVVGNTCLSDTQDALLWENGKEYDLNALAPSSNHLQEPVAIDDDGNIVVTGTRADGKHRLFLLTRRSRRD